MRTAEVRYTGTAVDGPYEQHDLSGFCSSENHAVKVGAYIISKRRHITHRLQLGVKPDAFNPTLAAGDLVRVRLDRIASTGANSLHDYLYEVDRIGKSITGEVQLDLTHFPVDASLASVVAQEVNSATGTGLLLPTGLSGITCDINSSADTSVPAETFTDGTFPDYGSDISDLGGFGDFGGGGGEDNPTDGLGDQSPGAGPAITGMPLVGNTLSYDPGCPGAYIEWRLTDNATGGYTVVGSGVAATYLVASEAAAAGKTVVGVGKCPDPSAPDGYGPEIVSSIVISPIGTPGTIQTLDPNATYEVFWTTTLTLSDTTNAEGQVVSPGGTTSTRFPTSGVYTVSGATKIEYYKTSWSLEYVIGGITSIQELPSCFRMINENTSTLLITPGNTQEGIVGGPFTNINRTETTSVSYSITNNGQSIFP
jgi:hypothetical protein